MPMLRIIIIILAICIILAIAYFTYYFYAMRKVKIPAYQVISQHGNIEIRQYGPMIIAEVTLAGTRNDTINRGFTALARYIFGENIRLNQAKQNDAVSEKIAMTAPVMHQQIEDDTWRVRFVMPAEYSLNTLPTPKANNINLINLPAEKFIVIRYSGTWSERHAQTQVEHLLRFIKDNTLQVAGPPVYAYYNPPFTLPFMRRNEIMLKLAAIHINI